MTLSECWTALMSGEKMRHKYFLIHEWIKLTGDEIENEEGFTFDVNKFEKVYKNPVFLKDWSKYEGA